MARRSDIQYIRIYTEGTAARKLEPAPAPRRKPKPARPKARKTVAIRVDPLAVAGIAVAVVMLVLMAVGLAKLDEVQQQRQALETYITQLQQENAALQDTYDNGYDLEEIRRNAEALGMVPVEDLPHIQIQVPPEAPDQGEAGWWESVLAFFTELFA